MKRFATLIIMTGLLLGIFPNSAFAGLTFGVRPAFPRDENSRTESIFVHTAIPGTRISEGVRVINNATTEKHLLLYAEDSAPSTGGGFACGQLSEVATGVGSWVEFDLSSFIFIETVEGEEATETSEISFGPSPTERYIDGVKPGAIPGTVDILIPPGKDLLVPFTIKVPENAQVGESNGCILVQEVKSEELDSGVSLSMRSGLRIAMMVPGDIKRELVFANFLKRRNGGSVYFMPSVKNTGNVSVDTTILVDVRYFFGSHYAEFGGQFPILRGETYEFNFEMKQPFWGGLYRAQAEFSYDNSPEAQVGVNTDNELTRVSSPKIWFFTVPTLTALFIELGALIVLALLCAWCAWRTYLWKKRKNWISYKATKNEEATALAARVGVKPRFFRKMNRIQAPYLIYKGQVLLVPRLPKKSSPRSSSTTSPTKKRSFTKTRATSKAKVVTVKKVPVKKRTATSKSTKIVKR